VTRWTVPTGELLTPQERRTEKKANKVAFKQEQVRQEKQILNVVTNIQGLKLS